jgi:hypothetical protein
MNIYTHVLVGQERKAINSLPDLLQDSSSKNGSEIKAS